nr:MAG TPA: hypothetical protein [Caudoviricetes sp.]
MRTVVTFLKLKLKNSNLRKKELTHSAAPPPKIQPLPLATALETENK